MSILQAIILGLIQGITEFLPVSSSGHLIFFPQLFGWSDQGIAFDVMVHVGTLFAVVVYFRKKIWQIGKSFFSSKSGQTKERFLAWAIILSIIPAGLVGYMLDTNSRSAAVVGWSLIMWGIVLGIADWYAKNKQKQGNSGVSLNHVHWKQVVMMSVAQAIALIPGTSRSGITISAGLFAGVSKTAAAEFSFLMSIPIIFLAGALKAKELITVGIGDTSVLVLGIGALSAALSGFVAIAFMLKLLQTRGFLPFAIYRVIIGTIILLVLV